MIPKIIHYCWFGHHPIPEQDRRWMESWKRYCPDYEIIEWNESNYDIHKNRYMEQAYEAKMWAFVPDYARLDILYQYGGIYLDTDVELVKSFYDLLSLEMFCGFENQNAVAFGLGFGARKGNPLIKEMLEMYETMSFLKEGGGLNRTASPYYQTQILIRHGLCCNNELQRLPGCTVFPSDYFAPMSFETGVCRQTKHTYSIHYYNMSWFTEEEKKNQRKRQRLYARYGKRLADRLLRTEQFLKFIKEIGPVEAARGLRRRIRREGKRILKRCFPIVFRK